jgi:protein-tyrosine kinase
MSRFQDARALEPQEELNPLVDVDFGNGNGHTMGSGRVAALPEAVPKEMKSVKTPVQQSFPLTPETILKNRTARDWALDSSILLSFRSDVPVKGAEEFRALRSRLYQAREKTPFKSVLIASAVPGEGRSFVAANLARVLALQPGCRVLLIDGDLRTSRLHSIFGTSASPGLSEYLSSEVDELDVIQRGSSDNLFLIPCGGSMSGQTELIANARFKLLLERVGPAFDWVVVDSTAAIPVSDASLMASWCDGVLMVVRANSTPFDVVRKACHRFREESLVGVLLNGSRMEPAARVKY